MRTFRPYEAALDGGTRIYGGSAPLRCFPADDSAAAAAAATDVSRCPSRRR